MTVVLLVALLKRNYIVFQISMHMSIFSKSFQDLQGKISFFDPSVKTSKLLFEIFFNLSLIQSHKFPLFFLYQHIHHNFVQLTKQLSKILTWNVRIELNHDLILNIKLFFSWNKLKFNILLKRYDIFPILLKYFHQSQLYFRLNFNFATFILRDI